MFEGRRCGREQRRGMGQGMMREKMASAGPGGECICPSCGKTAPHQAGVPCYQVKCPQCKQNMARK